MIDMIGPDCPTAVFPSFAEQITYKYPFENTSGKRLQFATENGPFFEENQLIKTVIFHTHVSLPEGMCHNCS